MSRPKRNTKNKLMDVAEKLFARRGFHGTSLRDITSAAKVDLSLVNYHFGSKMRLFTAVVERRGAVLNEERLQRLAEVRATAAPSAPSTESVVGAFLDPILERLAHAGPGWHSYFAVIAYVNNSPEWGRELMGRTFDATVREFIRGLMQSLPDAAPEDIYWGYNFLTGALTLSLAETGRIDALSDGLCRSTDVASLKARLGPYVAAGLRALAARRPDASARRN
ncbi:MAG TPA: TetR family transcriptional regulator [Steroidobacteraceae bacterium]|nr:TetR family transcriptional regulator [Steroidobacteraceae bacterium]